MSYHELKIWPEYFSAVASGKKRFELRKNDRDFKVGDTLILSEFDPNKNAFTGNAKRVRVTYLLAGPSFGLAEGFCILSFRRLPEIGAHFKK